MKRKRFIIVIAVVVIISNLPVINTEILMKIDSGHFRYANNDASFTYLQHFDVFVPWMSAAGVRGFIENTRPTQQNMEVFRLYKINPLCFWRWRYYLMVSIQFNYKSWDEIEPNRVPFVPNNKWQKF
ncbi:hypothetical protein FAZ15_22280 [Sphingobacterium olei]|uniref:Uncharacterized protein n=1 Tax=Sphingobacterium olei TaxID=2571155 RepID=A0A4U0N6J9_9SPHI|nr:hypothetical protein [Sphingobacterium olei]TJZ49427.1 hypothetical protein FAZ15_22280 [Sphingobacterium olei]